LALPPSPIGEGYRPPCHSERSEESRHEVPQSLFNKEGGGGEV
jgi:hypothetical protein